MATGTKRTMICCICMQRIDATIVQAKAHGWTVWVGGAFCKRHVESDDEPLRSEIDKWKKAATATQWDLDQTKEETAALARIAEVAIRFYDALDIDRLDPEYFGGGSDGYQYRGLRDAIRAYRASVNSSNHKEPK